MKKLFYITLCAVVLILVSVTGFDFYKEMKIKMLETEIVQIDVSIESLPVNEVQSCYAFNIYDKEKFVGFVDYMFVAKVEEITGTTYRDVIYLSEKNKYSGLPFTCYNITVAENIKGNLILNEIIPLRKLGGISINRESYYKYAPEEMPKVGGYYLFLGYADKDGELYVCDPNSAIYLGDNYGKKNISDNSLNVLDDFGIIEEYRKAYQNQDLSVRTGISYSSNYDV